jgi:hypothetical protein
MLLLIAIHGLRIYLIAQKFLNEIKFIPCTKVLMLKMYAARTKA